MTFKGLFVRWIKLAACAGILIFANIGLYLEASPILASHFSEPYIPLSDEEAHNRAIQYCKTDFYSSIYDVDCSKPSEQSINAQKYSHQQTYNNEVIEPLSEQIGVGFNIVFGLLYALLALKAFKELNEWFKSRGKQAIKRGIGKLSEATTIPKGLKDKVADRKVRQAEEDLLRVNSLHESGLITEEMFVKRKAELSAKL